MDKQSIELSRRQFEILLKLAYLGNWIVNSNFTDDEEGHEQSYDDTFNLLLANAEKFGLKKLSEYDESFQMWFPSAKLEESVDEFIDRYEDLSFWEELIHRLATRDAVVEMLESSIDTEASMASTLERSFEIESIYDDEFEEYGLNRLFIREDEE